MTLETHYNLSQKFACFEAFFYVIMSIDKAGIKIESVDIDFSRVLLERGRHTSIFAFMQVSRADLCRTESTTPGPAPASQQPCMPL